MDEIETIELTFTDDDLRHVQETAHWMESRGTHCPHCALFAALNRGDRATYYWLSGQRVRLVIADYSRP